MHQELRVCDLIVKRNQQPLFNALNFSLQSGEVLQVIGQNGCGKSSLLKALLGLVPIEQGRIYWGGQLIENDLSYYYQQLHYCGHQLALKPELTLSENLLFNHFLSISETKMIQTLNEFKLGHLIERKVKQLSCGQQRRVVLVAMLLSGKKLWLLDEPFAGLDKQGVRLLVNVLKKHIESRGLVIFTSHQQIDFSGLHLKQLALELH